MCQLKKAANLAARGNYGFFSGRSGFIIRPKLSCGAGAPRVRNNV